MRTATILVILSSIYSLSASAKSPRELPDCTPLKKSCEIDRGGVQEFRKQCLLRESSPDIVSGSANAVGEPQACCAQGKSKNEAMYVNVIQCFSRKLTCPKYKTGTITEGYVVAQNNKTETCTIASDTESSEFDTDSKKIGDMNEN